LTAFPPGKKKDLRWSSALRRLRQLPLHLVDFSASVATRFDRPYFHLG